MSHFTVIVIGDDHDKQLAPYHEYECTGRNDKYVQSIDQTEEIRSEYETYTRSMVELPDGTLVESHDGRFYRPPTPEERKKVGTMGCSTRVWDLSLVEGAKEVKKPVKEMMSPVEFAVYWHERPVLKPGEEPDLENEHKWGWIEADENGNLTKVIRRTNPNAKWDWYVVGGRWRGFFPLKEGAEGKVGESGAFGNTANPGKVDQCRWGDVDYEGAKEEARQKANEKFDAWEALFTEHGIAQSWTEVRESEQFKGDIDAARAFYGSQPLIKANRESHNFFFGCPVEEYGYDRDAYVQQQVNGALVPYAIVKDGKWTQKGEMGWWGVSTNEVDRDDWNAQVAGLFSDLPPDTQVTLVDCHI